VIGKLVPVVVQVFGAEHVYCWPTPPVIRTTISLEIPGVPPVQVAGRLVTERIGVP
jgi:hypothetical protein